MDYTSDQKKAIFDRPKGNILVSASAGSGKTRVLVDRIISMVIDDGIDIDQLLVVTFTKAAAKEMRERLQKSLRENLNQTTNPKQRLRLLTQIRKVPVADITTMDAYCQKLVSRYYFVLGIDPNFRILSDETEVGLLKDQVWDSIREDLYAADKDGSFGRLTENFSTDRDDQGLTDVVYRMNDFANVTENPEIWLDHAASRYQIKSNSLVESDLFKNEIKPAIINQIELATNQVDLIEKLAQKAQLDKDIIYADKIKKVVNRLKSNLKNSSWNDLRNEFQSFSLPQRPRKSKDFDDYQTEIHDQIGKLKDDINKLIKDKTAGKYFSFDENTNIQIIKESAKRVRKLISIVKIFRKAYYQTKLNRHLFEFIDIEHAAYDILTDKSNQAIQIQEKLQNQYYEILTDEYQDNNKLQDAILNRIAKKNPGNRFMVGDVKQSIYGFRLADPKMFVKKQRTYSKKENSNELISLAENFRSTANIDNFTNLIFSQIMSSGIGGINYGKDARLKFGASYYPQNLNSKISVLLYNQNDPHEDQKDDENSDFLNTRDNVQAEIIAQKIRNLIDTGEEIFDSEVKSNNKMRPVKFGDIAVISATRNNELNLADVFKQYQIPAEITGAKNYFKTTEIQIMMALLSVIDNPYQDIPLAAVLRSPIVGLNEDQLAYLRINRKTGNYYQAVWDFYRSTPNETTETGKLVRKKINRFMNQLKSFRDISNQQGIVTLIWEIYQQTGFLDYVGGMPSGYQRQVNLHALYERASDFEKNGFKGLYRFVRFIKRMQDRQDDLASAQIQSSLDAVHVMTIHGSKGLQFPIVFMNDIARSFNQQDFRQPYVLNGEFGLGINYFDTTTRVKRDTLQKIAMIDIEKHNSQAEEMRKLYVTLTRAEQSLYLVGTLHSRNSQQDPQDWIVQWQSKTNLANLLLPASEIGNAQNYLDWIGPAISRHKCVIDSYGTGVDSKVLDSDAANFSIHFYSKSEVEKEMGHQKEDCQKSKNWLNELNHLNLDENNPEFVKYSQILDFKYPFSAATTTTAYQSVSEIKRLFDDPDNMELGQRTRLDLTDKKASGRFIQQKLGASSFISDSGNNQRISAADIGTATHLVLQKLSLSKKPTSADVSELIGELVKQRILDVKIADKINIGQVVSFYDSGVGKKVLDNPRNTFREVPFSLLMRASDVFNGFDNDGDQQILIHGIIDGYVIDDDEVLLFDYKTDHINNQSEINKIVDRYRGQLELYSIALSRILSKPVSHKFLYLLDLNQQIEI